MVLFPKEETRMTINPYANPNVNIEAGANPPWWSDLLKQGLSVFQAERLRAENLKRIRQGLPPLTEAQARSLAPTANVNVSLDPQTKQWLFIGGGLALAFLLFRK